MGLWQLRPAELECAWYAFEAFDDVSFDEWVEFDGVAGEFIDDVVWRVEALPKGLASAVLWGCLLWLMSCRTPCMAWLSMVRPWCGWCADGDAGVRCDMWAILSIQCDMQPLE